MKYEIENRRHDQLWRIGPYQHAGPVRTQMTRRWERSRHREPTRIIPAPSGWEFISLDFSLRLGPDRPEIMRSPIIGWEDWLWFFLPLFPWGRFSIAEPIDFETEYHAYIRPNGSVMNGAPYPGVWPDTAAGWPNVDEYVLGCIEAEKMCVEASGDSSENCRRKLYVVKSSRTEVDFIQPE